MNLKNENYLLFSESEIIKPCFNDQKWAKVLKDLEFPDHYNYRTKDIDKILSYADDLKRKVITTEKIFC